jgi:hypothetical protein
MNPHQEGMIRERMQTLLQESHWLTLITSAKRGTVSLDLKPWISDIKVTAVAQQHSFALQFSVERANPLVSGGTTWVKPQWLLDFLMGETASSLTQSVEEDAVTTTVQLLQPVSWLIKRTSLTLKTDVLAVALEPQSLPIA